MLLADLLACLTDGNVWSHQNSYLICILGIDFVYKCSCTHIISLTLRKIIHMWLYKSVSFHCIIFKLLVSFDSQPDCSEMLIYCEYCKKLTASHRKWAGFINDKTEVGNVKDLAILFLLPAASQGGAGWKMQSQISAPLWGKGTYNSDPCPFFLRQQSASQTACTCWLIHQHKCNNVIHC